MLCRLDRLICNCLAVMLLFAFVEPLVAPAAMLLSDVLPLVTLLDWDGLIKGSNMNDKHCGYSSSNM